VIVAELLARRLAQLGVRRVYGEPIPGLDHAASGIEHVAVEDPDIAVLLADADGRIGEVDGRGRLGAALVAGPILHLSSKPGGLAPLQEVGSPDDLLDALLDPPGLLVPGTSAVHLDLNLTAEVPEGTRPSGERERRPVMTLDPSMADLRLLVVVGPGVVRSAAIDDLHSLSRTAMAPVVNTWGAKGVERWDSPWHGGTIGLQQRDLELIGLDEVDVVITSGIDPAELPGASVPHPLVQDVPPAQLGALCQAWASRSGTPQRAGVLFDRLAEVVRPMYEDDRAPLSPARAALHLSGALPDGAMAVVDPGVAGLWVSRSFPTSIPNSVCVPASSADGFAAAAALACRLEGRPVLAVTDERGLSAAETSAVLRLAESIGHPLALQVWVEDTGRDGAAAGWDGAGEHVDLLRAHLAADSTRVDHVPVDFAATASLVEVAGPVAAWPDV